MQWNQMVWTWSVGGSRNTSATQWQHQLLNRPLDTAPPLWLPLLRQQRITIEKFLPTFILFSNYIFPTLDPPASDPSPTSRKRKNTPLEAFGGSNLPIKLQGACPSRNVPWSKDVTMCKTAQQLLINPHVCLEFLTQYVIILHYTSVPPRVYWLHIFMLLPN